MSLISAIHEAGHCIVALELGLKVRSVSIGFTETEVVVPPKREKTKPRKEKRDGTKRWQIDSWINKLIQAGLSQEKAEKLIDNFQEQRPEFWDLYEGFFAVIPPVLSLHLVTEYERPITVYLAGWAAEEAFFSSRGILDRCVDRWLPLPGILSEGYEIGSVRRAEKDLKAIADTIGLPEYREFLMPCVFQRTPSYSLWNWKNVTPLVSNSRVPFDKQRELEPLVEDLLCRKEEVRSRFFGTRRGRVALQMLSSAIAKKERLSGSEVVAILEKAKRSWSFKVAGWF